MDLIKKDLSIIIPCHNVEDYICPLLDSFLLLNTQGLDIEYIFVLDDCTDNTQLKIEQRMSNLPYRILFCNVHSCGLARNVGLENSNSDFVWFVDGDDWILEQNFLPNLISYMRYNNIPIVRLRYDCNIKSFLDVLLTPVWQYIYNRNFINGMSFIADIGEDGPFLDEIQRRCALINFEIPYITDTFYYYYRYGRYDSLMSKVYKIYEK